MGDVNLTRGGSYRFPRNSLAKQEVYDQTEGVASRIAGEYQKGFFTAGGSFNPMFSIGQDHAIDVANVGVGDFVKLFVIPSEHTILDVAAKVIPTQSERGYNGVANADGLSFTVEARKYNQRTNAETGKVTISGDVAGIMANTSMMKRGAVMPADGGYFVGQDEYVILGLKVDSLPNDVSLSEVTCRVEVSSHVMDYDIPMHV